MTIPTVKFMSYNSTGMSAAKCQFIKEICDNHNVTYLSVQEHFKWSRMTDQHVFKSTAYRLGASKIDRSVCLPSTGCLLSVSDSSLNLRLERFGRQISLECSGMIQNTV